MGVTSIQCALLRSIIRLTGWRVVAAESIVFAVTILQQEARKA